MLIKIVKVIALLLGLLLLIFIIANAKDDELRPEVKEALNWQLPADAFDKDNGYILLHGMYAPIGQDPYLAGKAILEAEIERHREYKKTHILPTTFLSQNDKYPYFNWNADRCYPSETKATIDCYLKQSTTSTTVLAKSLQPLTDRFNAIKNSKKFIEVHTSLITFSLPHYAPITQSFDLERLLTVREISDGNIKVGMNRFAENNQFARRLLKASNTLVLRMIATSILQKDTRLLSEILKKYPETAEFKDQIQQILLPISTPEYSFKKTMQYENQLMLAMTENIEYTIHDSEYAIAVLASKALAKLIYLPNAMLNINYDFGELRILLSAVEASHIDETDAKNTAKRETLLGFGSDFIYIRNPIGKLFVGLGNDAVYKSYIERNHDLDGYLTLVRLQHRLIADKVTKEQLPQILSQYPNPYTLESMRLDTQNGFIVFDGRQPSNSNYNKSSSYQIAMP